MRPRALVIEDDASTRNALRCLVEGEGFDVDTAADGEIAFGFLERHRYNVLLVDLVLPKVSGIDVLEHVSQHDPSMLEKVIVVTGIDVTEVRKLFPTVPHALSKPILPARLRAIVRRWIPPGHEESDSGIFVA